MAFTDKKPTSSYDYSFAGAGNLEYKWIVNKHINECRNVLTYTNNLSLIKQSVEMLDTLLAPKKDAIYEENMKNHVLQHKFIINNMEKKERRLHQTEVEYNFFKKQFEELILLSTRIGMIIVKDAIDEI